MNHEPERKRDRSPDEESGPAERNFERPYTFSCMGPSGNTVRPSPAALPLLSSDNRSGIRNIDQRNVSFATPVVGVPPNFYDVDVLGGTSKPHALDTRSAAPDPQDADITIQPIAGFPQPRPQASGVSTSTDLLRYEQPDLDPQNPSDRFMVVLRLKCKDLVRTEYTSADYELVKGWVEAEQADPLAALINQEANRSVPRPKPLKNISPRGDDKLKNVKRWVQRQPQQRLALRNTEETIDKLQNYDLTQDLTIFDLVILTKRAQNCVARGEAIDLGLPPSQTKHEFKDTQVAQNVAHDIAERSVQGQTRYNRRAQSMAPVAVPSFMAMPQQHQPQHEALSMRCGLSNNPPETRIVPMVEDMQRMPHAGPVLQNHNHVAWDARTMGRITTGFLGPEFVRTDQAYQANEHIVNNGTQNPTVIMIPFVYDQNGNRDYAIARGYFRPELFDPSNLCAYRQNLELETPPSLADLVDPSIYLYLPLPAIRDIEGFNRRLSSYIQPNIRLPPLLRTFEHPQQGLVSLLARCIRFSKSHAQQAVNWRLHPIHVHEIIQRTNIYGRELLITRDEVVVGSWPRPDMVFEGHYVMALRIVHARYISGDDSYARFTAADIMALVSEVINGPIGDSNRVLTYSDRDLYSKDAAEVWERYEAPGLYATGCQASTPCWDSRIQEASIKRLSSVMQ